MNTKGSQKSYKIHVISNTHWDRAWVYPFQETRLLLIEFMDNLLNLLENDPEFHSFLLDSQTIAVEDYLVLRPEREGQIAKFVKSGRLIIGPWYTLPEEYIVNGESLVRNLLIGHRLAKHWGKVSKIGYTPFSYGQTSQMPQIYRGFDIDTIIFYRGINTKKSEFIFEGPDGSRLTGSRFGALSRFSYYFYVYRMARFGMGRDEWQYDWDRGSLPFRLNNKNHPHDHYYPLDPAQEKLNTKILPKQLKKLINDEGQHFSTSQIACMQGFDCSSPDPQERALIEACKTIVQKMGHRIFQSSLEDYMNGIKEELKNVEVITGESRNPGSTGKWTHLFGDVISSRSKIKRRNSQVEIALQRFAEPFSVLGWLVGGEYHKSSLNLAWKYLLQNHPHDNICGAGIDQMEKDMMYRFDQAQIISQGIMRRGMAAIQKQINNRDIPVDEAVITVFNPSPYDRCEVVTLSIDLPEKSKYKGFSIRDPQNNPLPFVEFKRETCGTLVRNLQDISLQLRSQRVNLHIEFKDIPALGYKTYSIKHEKQDLGKSLTKLKSPHKKPTLENDFLKVKINQNGTLLILDKTTNFWYNNQHYFEDSGEIGHPWMHMAPTKDTIITTHKTKAQIKLLETNSLLTSYQINHILHVPKTIEARKGITRRTKQLVEMPVESILILRKGQRWIDVTTKVINTAEQHRLRVCFPTLINAKVSSAEAAFDVVDRPIQRTPDSQYYNQPNPQYPMHRFIDISDGKAGLAILNDGIREYEAVDDEQRTLCITLIRGFTAMQSPVIDQWDIYPWMKLSQSLGENQWRYAILPHKGNWQEGEVYLETEKFNLPVETAQAGKGGGNLPKELSFIKIEPDILNLSALKKCEERESLILRIYNPTSNNINGKIIFYKPLQEAWILNMNEDRKTTLPSGKSWLNLNFGPKKILTCEFILDH